MTLRQALKRTLSRSAPEAPAPREVEKTDEEWRRELTAEQFRILRRRGTERPGSAEDVEADADGHYQCAGCRTALFAREAKFDSGTGWPSFADALPGAVEKRRDVGIGGLRVEVLCRRCGGHLGHVFRDGPRPTGQRYCINGGALAVGSETID